MPIDTLVNHLLAAKRSLSSMTLVLRANDLATAAGHAHEDTAILTAQAGFLRRSILDQAAILVRVRRSLQVTYDWGKKDFKMLIKAMDEVDGELGDTMEMLRGTEVHSGLRPKGEDRKTLLDFVDEASVHGMREAMKKSIQELQVSPTVHYVTQSLTSTHRASNNHLMAIYFDSIPTSATLRKSFSTPRLLSTTIPRHRICRRRSCSSAWWSTQPTWPNSWPPLLHTSTCA